MSLWNDLAGPIFDGVELAGFKIQANAFSLAKAANSLFLCNCVSLSLLSFYRFILWGDSVRESPNEIQLENPILL